MDLACWMCRKEPMPEWGDLQWLGLCPTCLQKRITELLALKGVPAP